MKGNTGKYFTSKKCSLLDGLLTGDVCYMLYNSQKVNCRCTTYRKNTRKN